MIRNQYQVPLVYGNCWDKEVLEETLNKNLVPVLNKVAEYGGTMSIFSNLYELTEEQIEAFTNLKNLFVCGKMYGICPQTNDYLTNTKGSFEKMMNSELYEKVIKEYKKCPWVNI